jgi:AcrR family transcriptional regulator
MSPRRRPSARTRILDVADRLFYEQGVLAVGVEAIVAAAHAAKTTLYGHFGSKDALVVACLERRAAQDRQRLERGLAAHGGPTAGRILHLYDLLADELAEPGYRGSPFVNVCVELGRDHPAAAVAHAHRQWLLDTLTALAAETAAPAPDALAAQLLQLYEAATVATQIGGDGDAARTARSAAEALLRSHPSSSSERARPPTGIWHPHPGPLAGLAQPTTAARLIGGGSAEAHRLVAFLNSAHLPDGDDHLADGRAGPWLAGWLAEALGAAPTYPDAATRPESAAGPDPTTGRQAATGPEAATEAAAGPDTATGLDMAVGREAAAAPRGTAGREGADRLGGAPAELLLLREGLRQLAVVNCGAQADPHAVAQAAAVLERAPLLVDLAAGG